MATKYKIGKIMKFFQSFKTSKFNSLENEFWIKYVTRFTIAPKTTMSTTVLTGEGRKTLLAFLAAPKSHEEIRATMIKSGMFFPCGKMWNFSITAMKGTSAAK